MSYYDQIKAMPGPPVDLGRWSMDWNDGYTAGHGQAKADAASLASRADDEITRLRAELAEAKAVVEKLPKDAEGKAYTGGPMWVPRPHGVVRVDGYCDTEGWSAVCATVEDARSYNFPNFDIDACYASRAAAEAARGQTDG